MKRKVVAACVLVGVVAVVFVWTMRDGDSQVQSEDAGVNSRKGNMAEMTGCEPESGIGASGAEESDIDGDIVDDSQQADDSRANSTEEEGREEESARAVEEFDAETDRWIDPEGKQSPTMKDIEIFRAKFHKIPKDHQEECLQRALNLVPDENVMLLTGILMDKSIDKEQITLVYNDILNRDDTVKKPILQIIYQDKGHSCWADTAWILDVTGELPEKN